MTVLETLADQQQYDFQEEKWRKKRANEKLVGDELLGFKTTGLFRYSRHPNFFAEQSQWWAYYIFSVACTGKYDDYIIYIFAIIMCMYMHVSCYIVFHMKLCHELTKNILNFK
jgi:steroid 5-alpha reductase family enzyme